MILNRLICSDIWDLMNGAALFADMWKNFLNLVREEVGSRVVDTWFCALSLYRWDQLENTVYLHAPNAFIQDWVEKKYTKLFQIHLGRLLNAHNIKIVFIDVAAQQKSATINNKQDTSYHATVQVDVVPLDNVEKSSRVTVIPAREEKRNSPAVKNSAVYINPTYSFDAFVVGPSNSLAYAAAQAVSESPGVLYNPLFVYGDSGLGKTHLLHAIGNAIKAKHKNASILYQTTDRFVNEFINAIRFDHVQKFKTRYQAVDVLLIDDVQFISHKEQTQEAFFHIFNALYDSHKQLVFSGDVYPHDLDGIPERLRSRFGWGLVTDLHVPTLETKIAILKKKASISLSEPLSDEVTYFIASQSVANIRQLEGSLIRVMAFAALTKQPITLDLAHQVLASSSPVKQKACPDTMQVVKAVSGSYGYSLDDMRAKGRSKELVQARHVVMYLLKKHTNCSLRDIGIFLGNRDHSTVIHGIDKVTHDIETSVEFKRRIGDIEHNIG
jgi:chromosomal replication initiator protein